MYDCLITYFIEILVLISLVTKENLFLNLLVCKWDVTVLLKTNFGNNFLTSVLEFRLYYVRILQKVKIQCHVLC